MNSNIHLVSFKKDKFSKSDAKKWLKDHKIKHKRMASQGYCYLYILTDYTLNKCYECEDVEDGVRISREYDIDVLLGPSYRK